MAERFGFTRDQIRYALEQTSWHFAEFLRAELVGQVDSASNLEAEIQELQRLLAR